MALFEAVQPINSTFGPLSDEQKHHMVKTAVHRALMASGVQDRPEDWRCLPRWAQTTAMDVWPLWAAVTQPVLVLRGAESDLVERGDRRRCWLRITAPVASPRH